MSAGFIPAIVAAIQTWKGAQARTRLPQKTGARATESSATASERYLLYCMIPLWVVTGLLDYIWHRKTSIETTAGTTESVIHSLMMTEAGLPMLLGLFFEINAGLILLMIAAFFAHSATAIWDVSYAVERRKVLPAEQHIHSFLEVLPFCAVSFVICLHPGQFIALFGAGSEKAQFGFKRKQPPLPQGYVGAVLAAVAVNGSAYAEEFIRCFIAHRQGLTGVDTPEAAHALFGK